MTIDPRCAGRGAREWGFAMKRFACGDVVPGCDARFIFANENQVLAAVAAHVRDDHGLVPLPPAMVTRVREAIRAAA